MIELNQKTQQDFLNREWVGKLLDAGVDMSDAKYCLYDDTRGTFICNYDKDWGPIFKQEHCIIPTYTVSELLYKLHEWVDTTIDGVEYSGALTFLKDAPFYIFYYDLYSKTKKEDWEWNEKIGHYLTKFHNENYICSLCKYPIESLASILIECHKKGIGDVGNISYK